MNPSTFARRGSNFVLNNRQRLSFRNVFTNLLVTALLYSLTIMALPISASMTATAAPVSTPESTNILVTVRHAPSINGLIGGSIQQLTGESVELGWGANITEDLLVPGKPKVKVFGYPHYQGTIDGTGNVLPSDYSISISGGASLRHVVRRTDPVTIPSVPEPPAQTGYRHVTINYSSQSAGNFATLEDLTVNQEGRAITVPPGTYGDFTANNTASFVFGVAGSSQPSVYNFQHLTLNDRSKLQVVGPVVLNVSGQVTVDCKATMGSASNSSLLALSIAHGGLDIGDHAKLYGNVTAPKGLAKVDGAMYGTLSCNRLCLKNGKILKGVGGVTTPANQAPQVDAGNPQTITLPVNTVNLTGSVTDDGLPTGSTVTSIWSMVSGPGNVAFGNASAPSTTATFSAAGQYVLQLSASDSQLTGSDTVAVTVIPQNQAPTVNAGDDQSVQFPNLATLNGSVADDGKPTGGVLTSAWSKVSGPGTVTFGNASAPSTTASFSTPGQYVLQLSASDSQLSTSDTVAVTVIPQNQPPAVNAGAAQTVQLPNLATLNGSVADDGNPTGGMLTSAWSKVSGPGTVTFGNAAAPSTTASFSVSGQYVLQLSASDSQLSTSSTVTVTVLPQNQAPVVSAGSDQTVQLPNLANLNGTVTDDGLPTATVTSTWTAVSGPGTVTFGNANSPVTTAKFSAPGDYVLRLTASDSLLSASSTVTVTVIPQNQPPVVSAGPDQTVQLPNLANLNGTVTDDGLPTATVTSTWTTVSGPGTVTFGNANSPVTTAKFSAPGDYVLRLTASDSLLSSSDDVNVTAQPSVPVVNAGPDQTITLPAVGQLNGSADDGVNPPNSLTYQWSMVSGPAAVSFGNANAPVTTVSFTEPGSYVLSLSASNGPNTGSDDVTINVNAGCVNVPSGLAGWWQGEGNANDASLNNNDGPVVNNVSFNAGKVGQAFTFNGTNSVQIPDSPSLRPSTFTLDAWVRFDSLDTPGAGDTGLQYMVFKRNSSPSSFESYSLAKLRRNGVDNFIFVLRSANQTALLTSNTAVVAGQFYHVAGTFDGTTMRLYVNGALETTTVPGFSPDYGTKPVMFGSTGESFDGKLTGALDEVHLFNRALSDAEIHSIFLTSNFGLCGGPVVDAGADQTINLPMATASLNGSATDANNPGSVLVFNWTVASGPGSVVFGDASAAVTTASFSVPGTYVLRLRANNGTLGGCDTVVIKVMPACGQPPAGLVSWWRGEGNANDFLNQNNGVLVNGTSFTPAMVGQGFLFNGTNSVTIADSPSLKPATFTLDTWVRFDTLDTPGAGDTGLQYLIFKRNSSPTSFESYSLAKLRRNGVDNFIFVIRSANQTALLTSSTAITAGQFYHVAGTFDGTIMRMYVNGVNETVLAPGFGPDYANTPVIFGSSGQSFDGKLTGVMDEVHIFNRALSDAEIQSIFLSAGAGFCTGAMNRMPVFNSGSVAATAIARNMSPIFGGNLFDQNRSLASRTRPVAREIAEKVTGFGTF